MIRRNIRHCELPTSLADCGSLAHVALSRLRKLLAKESLAATAVLAIDLKNVRRCGATFVGILAQAQAKLRQSGCRIQLRNAREQVAAVICSCGMAHLITETHTSLRNDDTHIPLKSQILIRETEEFLDYQLQLHPRP